MSDEIALPEVPLPDAKAVAILSLYREAIYRLQVKIKSLEARVKTLEEKP